MTVETGMRIASEPGAPVRCWFRPVSMRASPGITAIRSASSGPWPPPPASSTAATAASSTVTGADRLSWLHSIITQYVSDLDEGQSTESLVLSPHGHVEQHWQLTELEHRLDRRRARHGRRGAEVPDDDALPQAHRHRRRQRRLVAADAAGPDDPRRAARGRPAVTRRSGTPRRCPAAASCATSRAELQTIDLVVAARPRSSR